ncbi:hypothetical protein Q3C01_12275 [Bradyrhizobium sp. UFLA05-109]
MAKNKEPKRRRPPKGGYKPERPVVSVRFEKIIFASLKAEADARGVTISDVIHQHMESIWRPLFDGSHRDAAWKQLTDQSRRNVEAGLRELGYTRIVGPGGTLWAEPGANIPASIVKTIQEPNK